MAVQLYTEALALGLEPEMALKVQYNRASANYECDVGHRSHSTALCDYTFLTPIPPFSPKESEENTLRPRASGLQRAFVTKARPLQSVSSPERQHFGIGADCRLLVQISSFGPVVPSTGRHGRKHKELTAGGGQLHRG